MPNGRSFDVQAVRRLARVYLGVLIGGGVALAVLHGLFSELNLGRIYWFNLDKERNLATLRLELLD